MVNCNVVVMLMNINQSWSCDDGSEMTNATYFRSLVVGFNYLSHTRPNILSLLASKRDLCTIQVIFTLDCKESTIEIYRRDNRSWNLVF